MRIVRAVGLVTLAAVGLVRAQGEAQLPVEAVRAPIVPKQTAEKHDYQVSDLVSRLS